MFAWLPCPVAQVRPTRSAPHTWQAAGAGGVAHVCWLCGRELHQPHQHPVAAGLRCWGVQQHLAQRAVGLISPAAQSQQLVRPSWRPPRHMVGRQALLVLFNQLQRRLLLLPGRPAAAALEIGLQGRAWRGGGQWGGGGGSGGVDGRGVGRCPFRQAGTGRQSCTSSQPPQSCQPPTPQTKQPSSHPGTHLQLAADHSRPQVAHLHPAAHHWLLHAPALGEQQRHCSAQQRQLTQQPLGHVLQQRKAGAGAGGGAGCLGRLPQQARRGVPAGSTVCKGGTEAHPLRGRLLDSQLAHRQGQRKGPQVLHGFGAALPIPRVIPAGTSKGQPECWVPTGSGASS